MKILILFLMLYLFISIAPQKASAQDGAVSFQVFYDQLSPYGTWVQNPDYGYVWVPNVGSGFEPYATNGYWVFTDDGWTWISDYSWGWAPFHYGRWFTDATYGPMWVPGYEWGPGWVSWRRSNDYYGWAPIGPGISIGVAYGNDYNEHFNHYTYIRGSYMGRRNINKYYENHSNNDNYYRNTTVINNTRVDKRHNSTYNAGPDRAEVEKRVGKKVNTVAVKEINKPGQKVSKNQIQIYRPQVQQNPTNGQKPAPPKVENLNNVKPVAQRPAVVPVKNVNKPAKQQSQQPQKIGQSAQQKPSQFQQNNSSGKVKGMKQQGQGNSSKRMKGSKQQQMAKPAQNAKVQKQQPAMQQPAKQQQAQPQRKSQPVTRQQAPQQQQKPQQQQPRNEPPRQQAPQQQQQAKPQQNNGGERPKIY